MGGTAIRLQSQKSCKADMLVYLYSRQWMQLHLHPPYLISMNMCCSTWNSIISFLNFFDL